jgi:aryl-alcohol dehydrogenase-like predicted oxidoreductase
VITGATRVGQIQDTVQAAGVRLSDDVQQKIEDILNPS